MKNKCVSGVAGFVTRDHRYVYLGGSLMAVLALSLLDMAPNRYSFVPADSAQGIVVTAVCWLFLAVSALALLVKWTHWNTFDTTIVKQPLIVKVSRYLSYVVAAALTVVVLDRVILGLMELIQVCMGAESMPETFVQRMFYMSIRGKSMLALGVWTTVRLALCGTAIAFVLAMLMVFCRIQEPDKRDNDFVKFLKTVANKFSGLYVFVIRGTPMMVQALIIYYFVFGIFRDHTDWTVTEITRFWSYNTAGLVTISLNSTAYLAEVLRGGIMAIDHGQMEAARSLGMTNWQAMMKVVFPQAVKNSIPAIGNEFIINIKDSSVLSVIGVTDLMTNTKAITGIYYRQLEIYVVAAVLYLVLTYLSSLLLKYLSKKLETPALGIPSSN